MFRTNYHNQYYSAFGDDNNSVAVSKRLWLQKLSGFSPQVICSAAEKIIAESDFLPTLYRMLQACKRVRMPGNLPTGYDAYREACIAPSPKVENNWSHPVVYLAGRDCGWYLLANSGESGAFKRFSEIYRSYCDRVAAGERFAIDTPAALPETSSAPADREIAEVQLGKLRKLFP